MMRQEGTVGGKRRRSGVLIAVAALVIAGAASLAWVLAGTDHPVKPSSGSNPSTRPPPGTPTTGPPASSPPGSSRSSGIALGVYVKPSPTTGNAEATLAAFESSIGRRLAIVQTFTGWQAASGTPIPFPTAFASYASSIGATPMVTWQPEQAVTAGQSPGGLLSDQPNFSLAQLSSGRYDGYIRSWADQAKAFGRVVYVRLMHEMNDKTYPWSIGVNGNTGAGEYIATWQHIVHIFQTEGATNVQFVWCVGAKPSNPNPAEYFPGDNYVSWISIDGYNRGTPWESFTTIFSQAYSEITAVSSHPVMIGETGCVEDPTNPGAKAAWITSAFDEEIPQQFPRIRAVLYFDAPGRGFSYALSSSSASLNAFSRVAASPQFQANSAA